LRHDDLIPIHEIAGQGVVASGLCRQIVPERVGEIGIAGNPPAPGGPLDGAWERITESCGDLENVSAYRHKFCRCGDYPMSDPPGSSCSQSRKRKCGLICPG
jgi:hypothetical protein